MFTNLIQDQETVTQGIRKTVGEMYATTNLRGYTAGECYPLPTDEYTKKACHCLYLKEMLNVEFALLSHSILQIWVNLVLGLNSC